MNYKIFAAPLILLSLYSSMMAQTENYGLWTSVGAQKKLKNWDLELNSELRTNLDSVQIHRWNIEFEVAYRVIKPIKIGVRYKYIYFHDLEYADFQPRMRYALFVQGKQNVGDFKFTLREQFQRTIKDESDRIKENGNYDNYKINPEWIWRNQLKVAFNIPRFPVTPSLLFESFYQLNNPDGNTVDNLRYILSFEYKFNKQNDFKFYGLIDKEINVDNPVTTYVCGFAYTHSF